MFLEDGEGWVYLTLKGKEKLIFKAPCKKEMQMIKYTASQDR